MSNFSGYLLKNTSISSNGIDTKNDWSKTYNFLRAFWEHEIDNSGTYRRQYQHYLNW